MSDTETLQMDTPTSPSQPAQPPAPAPAGTDQAAPSAETQNTEPADHMIPKARFDEINGKYRELLTQQEQAAKEREAIERKQLEEQNRFRELYEKEVAAREAAVAEMKALSLKALRRQIATDTGLPGGLADRLQGETEEELKADAAALLSTLPATGAPPLDGGAGGRNKRLPNVPPWEEIQEQAARFGVSAKYLAEQYGVPIPGK